MRTSLIVTVMLAPLAAAADDFDYHWSAESDIEASFAGYDAALSNLANTGYLSGDLVDAQATLNVNGHADASYTTQGNGYRLGAFASVTAQGYAEVDGCVCFASATTTVRTSWQDELRLVGSGTVPFGSLNLNWMADGQAQGLLSPPLFEEEPEYAAFSARVGFEDRTTGESSAFIRYGQSFTPGFGFSSTGTPNYAGMLAISKTLGANQDAQFEGSLVVDGFASGGARLEIGVGHSLVLYSITFPDGTTPESHGFTIEFDSGLPSPNIGQMPGDVDHDSLITGHDYTIFAAFYGRTGALMPGDLNGDGVVTPADYTIWADLYELPVEALPAPEPSAVALLGLGGIVFIATRRGRRARR